MHGRGHATCSAQKSFEAAKHMQLQDDATEAEWYDVTKLPSLAFDHKLIIRTAFEHLLQHSETKSTGTSVLLHAVRAGALSLGQRAQAFADDMQFVHTT